MRLLSLSIFFFAIGLSVSLPAPESSHLKLAYDVYPPPEDSKKELPPVVLVHGMLDSKKTWKYVAPCIANRTGRCVYTVDARNHGDSPWDDEFTIDIVADDLDRFLTDQNITKSTLVGHCIGGRAAATLALRKPEIVEQLVVEDMPLTDYKANHTDSIVKLIRKMREALVHIPAEADDKTAKDFVLKYIAGCDDKNETEEKHELELSMLPLKKNGSHYCWEANLDVLEDFVTSDKFRQVLSGEYDGKSLFIYGEESVFEVDKDPLISELFPRATKLGIEKGYHFLHLEFPDRFVEEVVKFIS